MRQVELTEPCLRCDALEAWAWFKNGLRKFASSIWGLP